jgi:hypothetical protein
MFASTVVVFANTSMKYENHETFDITPFLTAINTKHLTCKGFASFMYKVFQGLNDE